NYNEVPFRPTPASKRNFFFRVSRRRNPKPKKVLANNLRKNTDLFLGEKKKPNKCRVLKALSLRNLVKQRVTALAEVQRPKTAAEFFAIRQQVLRRIFTARRHTASKRSRACSARCSFHRAIRSQSASKKLTKNIFMSRRTKPSIPSWSNFGTRARRSI